MVRTANFLFKNDLQDSTDTAVQTLKFNISGEPAVVQ